MGMWREGKGQFIPFIVTVSAIVLTDLLVGIVIGLIVAKLLARLNAQAQDEA